MPAEINQQIIRYRCEICAQHAHSLSTFRRRRPSGDHRRSESRKRTSSVCAVSVISDVANAASAADSKATPPAQMKNTRRAAAAAGHKSSNAAADCHVVDSLAVVKTRRQTASTSRSLSQLVGPTRHQHSPVLLGTGAGGITCSLST